MSNLKTAIECFRSSRAYYDKNAVYDRYKLSPIWRDNIQFQFDKVFRSLTGDENPKDVIGFLHDKAFFDTSVPPPQLTHALDWFERFMDSRQIKMIGTEGESPFFADDRCTIRNGRRVSSDFLWRVCLYSRLCDSYSWPLAPQTIVELGSGSGNFARLVKLDRDKATYVCIDLPESLFFAQLFLTENFPEARVRYIREPGEKIEDLKAYDFVFVPTEFAGCLEGHEVDLFVNMNSLGEMTNEVIAHWFNFAENTIKAKYCFLLNRFLNRISKEMAAYRQTESGCSLTIGQGWKVLDWEVDPDFERSPYGSTLLTRNLLVIAERCEVGEARAEWLMRVPGQDAIAHEDWAIGPGWDNYKMTFGHEYPPRTGNCRGDLNLTLDLTMTGSLFAVWDRFRLFRDVDSAQLLMKWMSVHCDKLAPFEEMFFLRGFV